MLLGRFPTGPRPMYSPTPIPSAVDPHVCGASPVPCLLGLSWGDGGRDGSSPPPHPTAGTSARPRADPNGSA